MKILKLIQIEIHYHILKNILFLNKWKIKNFIRGTLRLNGWVKHGKIFLICLENPSNEI